MNRQGAASKRTNAQPNELTWSFEARRAQELVGDGCAVLQHHRNFRGAAKHKAAKKMHSDLTDTHTDTDTDTQTHRQTHTHTEAL